MVSMLGAMRWAFISQTAEAILMALYFANKGTDIPRLRVLLKALWKREVLPGGSDPWAEEGEDFLANGACWARASSHR